MIALGAPAAHDGVTNFSVKEATTGYFIPSMQILAVFCTDVGVSAFDTSLFWAAG